MERHQRSKEITRISIRSVLPVAAALCFLLGAFASVTAALGAWLSPGQVTSLSLSGPISLSFGGIPSAGVFLMYPVLSAVAGAAAAAALAALYNLVARRVGPLRVTFSE